MKNGHTGVAAEHRATDQSAEVQAVLVEILADTLGIERATITLETDLVKDLGLESIELINIVATIKERTGVDLDVRRLLTIKRLGQVVDLVVKSS